MGGMHMRRQDLLELYQLAHMYQMTYPGEHGQAIAEVMDAAARRYSQYTGGLNIAEQTNPRGAGRKPAYTESEDRQTVALLESGASLREAARASGCSVGHVQDVARRFGLSRQA